MNTKIFSVLLIFGSFTVGCFGNLQTETTIFTDPNSGLQTQTWFYSPDANTEKSQKKLVQHIRDSSLYKICMQKEGVPMASYSEPIFSSLILACKPKNGT